jgi:hypothetical protein
MTKWVVQMALQISTGQQYLQQPGPFQIAQKFIPQAYDQNSVRTLFQKGASVIRFGTFQQSSPHFWLQLVQLLVAARKKVIEAQVLPCQGNRG